MPALNPELTRGRDTVILKERREVRQLNALTVASVLLAVRVGIFPADASFTRAFAPVLRNSRLFEVKAVEALSKPDDLEGLGVLVLGPEAKLSNSGLIAVDAFLQAGGGVVALGKAAIFLPPFVIGGTKVWGKRLTVSLPGGGVVSFLHPDPFHFFLLPSPLSEPASVDELNRVTGVVSKAGHGRLVALGDPLSSGAPTGGQFKALLLILRVVTPSPPPGPASAYVPLAAARASLFNSLLEALDRARSVEWRLCPALDRIAKAARRLRGGKALEEEALRLKGALSEKVESACQLASREAWEAMQRLYREEEGIEFLPEVEAKCSEIASIPVALLREVEKQIESVLPLMERRLRVLQRGFVGLLPVRRPLGWEFEKPPFIILSEREASEALIGSCAEAGAAACSSEWSVRKADLSERSHVLWFTISRSASLEAVRAALPFHFLYRNSLAGVVIENLSLPEAVPSDQLVGVLTSLLREVGLKANPQELAQKLLSFKKGLRPSSSAEVAALLELERMRREELAKSVKACSSAARMRRDDLIVCPVVRGPKVEALPSIGEASWAAVEPECGGASAAFFGALLESTCRGRALLCVDARFTPSSEALLRALFLSIAFADGPLLKPFENISPYKPPGFFPAPKGWPPSWNKEGWQGIEKFRQKVSRFERMLLGSVPAKEVGLIFSLRALELNRALGREAEAQYLTNLAGWFELLKRAGLPVRPVIAEAMERSELVNFKALIVPDALALPAGFEEALRDYVREGGALVATADTSLYDPLGRRRPDYGLADLFGVRRKHEAQGALSIILTKEASSALRATSRRAGIDPERRYVVVASSGDRRIWANFSSGHSAIVAHSVGKGICVFISYPKVGLCYEGTPLRGERLDPFRLFRRGLPELVRAILEGAMERTARDSGPSILLEGGSPFLLHSLRSLGEEKFALHLVNLCPLRPAEGLKVRVLGGTIAKYLTDGSKVIAREAGKFTWLAVRPVGDYECILIEKKRRA